MSLRDIWRREFSLSSMKARAARKSVLKEAKWDLEEWTDYGDPLVLARAINKLRGVT